MRSSTRILDLGREKHIMARPAQLRSVASQAGSDPICVWHVGAAEPKHIRRAGLTLLISSLSARRRFSVEQERKHCDPAGDWMLWQHKGFPRRKLFPSIVEILLTGEDVEFQAALPRQSPRPKRVDGLVIWDRLQLDAAYFAATRGAPASQSPGILGVKGWPTNVRGVRTLISVPNRFAIRCAIPAAPAHSVPSQWPRRNMS
jgi:hypothetical protein